MNELSPAVIQRVSATGLASKLSIGLRGGWATLILDVRPRADFDIHPWTLPDAIPISLSDKPVLLPDVDRQMPLLIYCQSNGQITSTEVAGCLQALGYRHVWILEGGLEAWSEARQRVVGVQWDLRSRIAHWISAPSNGTTPELVARQGGSA